MIALAPEGFPMPSLQERLSAPEFREMEELLRRMQEAHPEQYADFLLAVQVVAMRRVGAAVRRELQR